MQQALLLWYRLLPDTRKHSILEEDYIDTGPTNYDICHVKNPIIQQQNRSVPLQIQAAATRKNNGKCITENAHRSVSAPATN